MWGPFYICQFQVRTYCLQATLGWFHSVAKRMTTSDEMVLRCEKSAKLSVNAALFRIQWFQLFILLTSFYVIITFGVCEREPERVNLLRNAKDDYLYQKAKNHLFV